MSDKPLKAARDSVRGRGRPKLEDASSVDSQVLDVALQEFLRSGYGAASMSKIVEAAGISKTTLYSRYPSKEALFRAIIHQQIESLTPSIALESNGHPLDLERGLISYANHMLALSLEGDLLEVNRLMYSESHRFAELGAAAAERTALGIRRIAAFIDTCAAADGFPCRDAVSVAELFILTIRGWFVNVMLTNRSVSVEEREAWVVRAVQLLLAGRREW